MNYELLIGLTGLGLGPLLTLAFQAHLKAQKAVKEANAAVVSVNNLSDLVRHQVIAINEETKAHIIMFTSDYDKRMQKLETRVDDQGSRVAALQIKR